MLVGEDRNRVSRHRATSSSRVDDSAQRHVPGDQRATRLTRGVLTTKGRLETKGETPEERHPGEEWWRRGDSNP